MRHALEELTYPPVLGGDRAPPPLPSLDAAIAKPYADTTNLITREAGCAHLDALVGVSELCGLMLSDNVCAESAFAFLGDHFDGASRELSHAKKRMWLLQWALAEVLRRGWSSGVALRIVHGHLYHHFGLAVGGLSVFQNVFAFAEEHSSSGGWLPAPVRDELWVAKPLVFCGAQALSRPCFSRALCGHPSGKGYSYKETWAPPREILDAIGRRERWRFLGEP